MESESAPEKPWDQQPGEPKLWFKRFSLYLLMGPTRTVAAAYCDEFARRHPGKTCLPRSATNWRVISSRWHWPARAEAWDKEQLTLAGVAIRNKLVALQAQRLDMTAELINQARTVLQNAHLEDADETQSRALIGEMRMLVRDMAALQQRESTLLPEDAEKELAALTITADDLRAAQREFERRQEEANAKTVTQAAACAKAAGTPQQQHRLPAGGANATPSAEMLVVCQGENYEAVLGVKTLRTLRAATGLQYRRVLDATRHKLAGVLKMAPRLRRPVPMLHITLPAAAEGIAFEDKEADPTWLRRQLAGVPVLLLSDYRGEELGDWLEVVPHVVLLHAGIAAAEATVVAREFWQGIGSGQEPPAALEAALAHCTAETRRLVESRFAQSVPA
ncbi:MAG: hypothetical protein U0X20_26760 [Caldilineaceae bacterium]